MGLHEGPVVAMADAYAQLTRNAAFVKPAPAGGVGNAMGAIFTAARNYAPLVRRPRARRAHASSDPFLYAEDATMLPRPYVKWALEPARAADVPSGHACAAYTIANVQRPYYGPTFVSVRKMIGIRSRPAGGAAVCWTKSAPDDCRAGRWRPPSS